MKEGIVILIVGVVTVFLALLSLFLVFQFMVPIVLKGIAKRSTKSSESLEGKMTITGEETAAVSAAIHLLLNEVHDEENTVLTIHQSEKEYSPWSSKIYVTHHFNRD